MAALVALVAVALASAAIGSYGVRVARSTSDFLVASRTVGPVANAGAISGEYLSAASFLGVAGLILRDGVDALWYPVGFTAGYLALVLFVAAPLRRSGAYTVPDCWSTATPTPRSCCCPPPCSAPAGPGSCWAGWWRPGRGRPSCPPRRG